VTIQAVLLPLFVEVLMTFGLLIWLAPLRGRAVRDGLRPEDIALREARWPADATKVANAFSNQFELPVLFYLLTVLVIITQHASFLFVMLAWVFVALRLLHAFVHTGSNVVRQRGGLYGAGALVLLFMWLLFIFQILTV
jgi:hypothetical protein